MWKMRENGKIQAVYQASDFEQMSEHKQQRAHSLYNGDLDFLLSVFVQRVGTRPPNLFGGHTLKTTFF